MKPLILVLLIGAISCLADVVADDRDIQRTANYLCHGYSDGKIEAFGDCITKLVKYNFRRVSCSSPLYPGKDGYICDDFNNQSSLPWFKCFTSYMQQEVRCEDWKYEILQCYQLAYGKFPQKYDC